MNSSNIYKTLFFGLIGLLALGVVGYGSYYYGSHSQSRITSTTPSPVTTQQVNEEPATSDSMSTQPLISPEKSSYTIDSVKKLLGDSYEQIEAIGIHPNGVLIAYAGVKAKWKGYEFGIYNTSTKAKTIIFSKDADITGRGGTYKDNFQVTWSPTGTYVFLNRTGINIPLLIVGTQTGEVKFKLGDEGYKGLGHATWVGTDRLVYVEDADKHPQELNVVSGEKVETKLPTGIYLLAANKDSNKILAFSDGDMSKSGCFRLNLGVFSYPDGAKLKSISDTYVLGTWKSNNEISFQKITSCDKLPADQVGMFEYQMHDEPATMSL